MELVKELPEIFEEFAEQRQKSFLVMKEVKDKGIPVIGAYCTYFPQEIAMAMGAVTVGLCSTSDETIPVAEKDLPKNLCPMVKASYGFAVTDKCPFFYFSDVVVGETTCDGKKKMYELMKEFKNVYIMELPNTQNESALELWKKEIIRFKEYLEETFNTTITEEQVRAAVLDFVGDYNQVPPMYSALKINGKKLYELAREGKTVERAARRVQIFDIEILSIALPRVTMKVHCSKGTYIRTLCHDIGQKLGCGACMEKLTRTKVSRFEIKDSLTLAQIEVLKKEDRLSEILIPIDQMFANYPSIIVSGEAARLAYNGNGIKDRDVRKDENILDEAYVRVYDDVEDFIGVYQYHEKEREYRIRKMFYIKEEK